jgi:hypothetical protein
VFSAYYVPQKLSNGPENFALQAFCEIIFTGFEMNEDEVTSSEKEEQGLQAVLALFNGQAVAQVCQYYNICRSDLYKYRRRALAAMRSAMKDRRRGPKRPSNHLPEEKEQRIKLLSERCPTLSSYQVNKSLAPDSPSSRTIQRVRKRLRLPHHHKTALSILHRT